MIQYGKFTYTIGGVVNNQFIQQCIFCRSTTGTFTTREHILPESLGGGDWALLPNGLFCDQCQNRFGSAIEQQALANYPFSLFRVLLGIPTKKGKAPWLESWEGVLRGSLQPGQIGYDPSGMFETVMEEGNKTQIRILAHPIKPDMVCRTLLKIGIEVVAANDQVAVFDEKFDAARNYALRGEKTGTWWYLQRENIAEAFHYIRNGVTLDEWISNVKLEVVTIDEGMEVFHLKLLYMNLMTPLESRIQPLNEDLEEPEYRLFIV